MPGWLLSIASTPNLKKNPYFLPLPPGEWNSLPMLSPLSFSVPALISQTHSHWTLCLQYQRTTSRSSSVFICLKVHPGTFLSTLGKDKKDTALAQFFPQLFLHCFLPRQLFYTSLGEIPAEPNLPSFSGPCALFKIEDTWDLLYFY